MTFGTYTAQPGGIKNITAVATLETQLSNAAKQLHGAAASIADSKERYAATHDTRYLESVKAVLPLYQYWLTQYQSLAAQLGGREIPSNFLATLSETSDWLLKQGQNLAEGITGTVAALPKIASKLPDLLMVALVVGGIAAAAYVLNLGKPLVRAAASAV